jgi:predicted nucleic acid-binding protein
VGGPGAVRYVLDTTFAIDYLRGEPAAVERFERLFADGDDPYINEVVVCEVAVGQRLTDLAALSSFIRAVAFVQPGPDAALDAGAWRRAARARGRTLGLADALIAASANALGATVLTRNRGDFELTPAPIAPY